MTTETQKKLEIHFATKVSESLSKSWEIISSPDEREWPDILVTENSHQFGLEIREIYPDESSKGSKKRGNEIFLMKNIYDISIKYYEISDIPLKVNFIGSIENQPLILNALIDVSTSLSDFGQKRLKPFKNCILYVRKLPSTFEGYNIWTYVSDRVGWVGDLHDNLIQEKINEKSKKLIKYKKHINDVRLLLVCNREFNSGKFIYTQKKPMDLGGFKEVYFLSYPDFTCTLNNSVY